MSSNKNVYEMLDEIAAGKTKAEKKASIIGNHSTVLQLVLRAVFHPNIRFVIDTIPQYIPSDAPVGLGLTSLDQEIYSLYLFELGHPKAPPNLSMERRMVILTQMLESLEAREAEVLIKILKKDLQVNGLTKELAVEVYPHLLD